MIAGYTAGYICRDSALRFHRVWHGFTMQLNSQITGLSKQLSLNPSPLSSLYPSTLQCRILFLSSNLHSPFLHVPFSCLSISLSPDSLIIV